MTTDTDILRLSYTLPHSWRVTGFVARVMQRMPLVKQDLPTLPEHMNSPPVFNVVRVARSLVFCVVLCGSLSFCTLSFGHCVICSSLIYGFWFSIWYLHAFLVTLYPMIHLKIDLCTIYQITQKKIMLSCLSGFQEQPEMHIALMANGKQDCMLSVVMIIKVCNLHENKT